MHLLLSILLRSTSHSPSLMPVFMRPPMVRAKGRCFGSVPLWQQLDHPWSSYVIVPLFALANASVSVNGWRSRHPHLLHQRPRHQHLSTPSLVRTRWAMHVKLLRSDSGWHLLLPIAPLVCAPRRIIWMQTSLMEVGEGRWKTVYLEVELVAETLRPRPRLVW